MYPTIHFPPSKLHTHGRLILLSPEPACAVVPHIFGHPIWYRHRQAERGFSPKLSALNSTHTGKPVGAGDIVLYLKLFASLLRKHCVWRKEDAAVASVPVTLSHNTLPSADNSEIEAVGVRVRLNFVNCGNSDQDISHPDTRPSCSSDSLRYNTALPSTGDRTYKDRMSLVENLRTVLASYRQSPGAL